MITERTKVLNAYIRAVLLGADHQAACDTVAQVLSLPAEAVHEVAVDYQAEEAAPC